MWTNKGVSIWRYQCILYNNRITTIDGAYVTGVSVTHGSPRQHIWTFAAGFSDNDTRWLSELCPCNPNSDASVPSFVGEDYFCDSGLHERWHIIIIV